MRQAIVLAPRGWGKGAAGFCGWLGLARLAARSGVVHALPVEVVKQMRGGLQAYHALIGKAELDVCLSAKSCGHANWMWS